LKDFCNSLSGGDFIEFARLKFPLERGKTTFPGCKKFEINPDVMKKKKKYIEKSTKLNK